MRAAGQIRSRSRRPALHPLAPGLLLAATGLAIWTGLSAWGGLGPQDDFQLREAWTTPAYFALGLPLMGLAVALAAFLAPTRIWRWPLWLVAGHQAGVLLVGVGNQSWPSLVILAVVVAVLLATLFAVPAILGSLAARRLAVRAG